MSAENIQEEYIKFITMKMNYNIFKTSIKDELDNKRIYEGEISRYRSITIRRLERMLLDIEMILKEIDHRIEHILMKMPIHLEVEVEGSIRKHLLTFTMTNGLRI